MSYFVITNYVTTSPCKGYFNVDEIDNKTKTRIKKHILFVIPQLYKTSYVSETGSDSLLNELFMNNSIKKISEESPMDTVRTVFHGELKMRTYLEMIEDIGQKIINGIFTPYICEISAENLPKITTRKIEFDYNYNYINDDLRSYLKSISMEYLIHDDQNCVIFPHLQYYSPSINDHLILKQIDQIADKNHKRKQIYRYLQSFVFFLVLKDTNGSLLPIAYSLPAKAKLIDENTINGFSKIEIKTKIDLCKKTIIDFYQNVFGLELNDFLVKISICRNLEYRYFTLKFMAFNSYTSDKYESFIEENYWMDLNRYMSQISGENSRITLTDRILASDANIVEKCDLLNNNIIEYAINQEIDLTGGKYTTYQLRKYLNPNNDSSKIIELFSTFYDTEGKSRYVSKDIVYTRVKCSWTMLLQIGSIYHNLVIQSERFDTFHINQIENIINQNQNYLSINSAQIPQQSGQSKIFIDDMNVPCRLITYPIKQRTFNLIENQTKYLYDKLLEQIVTNGMVDNLVIVSHIYLNEYKNKSNYVNLIKSELAGHPIFDKFFKDEILFSDEGNFVINNKTLSYVNNIIPSENLYVMWYLAPIKITNHDKFIELLKTIKMKQKLWEETKNYTIDTLFKDSIDPNLKKLIVESTNFYELFEHKKTFVYNSRHLEVKHKKEINRLLYKFTISRYVLNVSLNFGNRRFSETKSIPQEVSQLKINIDTYSDLFNHSSLKEILRWIKKQTNLSNTDIKEMLNVYMKKYPYTAFCHYPNAIKYQIFHMHITNYDSDLALDLVLLSNQTIKYHNTADYRSLPWKYIKNTDLRDADILFASKYSYQHNLNELIQKFEETKKERGVGITTADFKNTLGNVQKYIQQ